MTGATPSIVRNDAGRAGSSLSRLTAGKIGLWTFMAVVTVLFLLLAVAFLERAQLDDWQALGDPGQPLASPFRLWLNTAMLVASSMMMEIASMSARRGNLFWTRIGLVLGGIFAAAFISGQIDVWQTLTRSGYLLESNPANSFFYLITGLHGLHLIGGLVAWTVITVKAWRDTTLEPLRRWVGLTAIYWHFLLAVWLAMFALLASSKDTIEAFARLCGLR